MQLARTGGTTQYPLYDILAARMLNQTFGGAFVSPWQVADLPDEWIEAANAVINDLPKMRQGIETMEALKAKIRSGHPTYGKYH